MNWKEEKRYRETVLQVNQKRSQGVDEKEDVGVT